MGWISHNRPVELRIEDTFNDRSGNLGAKWKFKQGVDGTDATITASEVIEPSGATIAPWAFLTDGLPDTSLRWRAACDMRIRDAGNAANPGQYSRMSIHAYNLAEDTHRLLYAARLLGVTVNKIRLERFASGAGGVDTVAETAEDSFSPGSEQYYRVGLEALDSTIRVYISPSNISPGDGDATLEPRATLSYDPNALVAGETICVGFLMTIGALGANHSAIDNIKIERLPNDPFHADFPEGAFFELPLNPYALYKTTSKLHEMLTQAKLR